MGQQPNLLPSIIEGIKEKKGTKIISLDLNSIPSVICNHFVICQGNSPLQVKAIAESVQDIVQKQTNEKPLRVHGKETGEWIALDYADVIVHIFVPALREYYKLENLWADAKISFHDDENSDEKIVLSSDERITDN